MDFLLELARNPASRSLIQGLKLPLPMPPLLQRERRAWQQRIFNDENAVVWTDQGATSGAELLKPLAATLASSGARVTFAGPPEWARPFEEPAQAWGEPLALRTQPNEHESTRLLVCDASFVTTPDDLDRLYERFRPWVPQLRANGRVVVLTRPMLGAAASVLAARQALEGFTRSLAKELGRKGTTVNLLRVAPGAEDRVAGPLRYLLSARSAFVTSQPLDVSAKTRKNATLPWQSSLTGKTCVVTGASRGIGAATARALAREGAHVVIVDVPGSEGDASLLARELGGSVLLLDVSAPEATDTLASALAPRGGADLIVHNAGVTRDKTFARMTPEQWSLVLNVNLKAAIDVTSGLLQRGLVNDEARLVFLASVSGIAGNPGQTNYATSKAGLIGYVRGLSAELAERGVTVNAVAPGLIETRMTAAMPFAIREAARRLSALSQGGLPDDVAEAITFLALPSSDGVTGSVLRVCGGALVGA